MDDGGPELRMVTNQKKDALLQTLHIYTALHRSVADQRQKVVDFIISL